MKSIACGIVCLGFLLTGLSRAADGDAVKILKKMDGCFKVTYEYFTPERKMYRETIPNELAIVSEEKDGSLKIERRAFFGVHWRERWTEQKDGQWEQKVIDRDGKTVRYTCTSPLSISRLTEGNEGARRCEAAKSFKPARRFATYDDNAKIDHLDRRSLIHITDKGWTDNQRNNVKDKDGKLLFEELGMNHYVRLPDKDCDAIRPK